jgi:hypothetical protein
MVGYLYPLLCAQDFLVGQIKLLRNLAATSSSWWSPFLSCLLFIPDYSAVLSLRFFKGKQSRFHVLHARTRFRLYRVCRVPFSCFACPNSFSTVPSASGLVFIFCALGLIFGGTEGVRSLFHVLRSRTRFRLYQGRRVPFSYFALQDSF